MKKILLTFCLLAATIAATAADFQSGDLYYNILDEDAATVEVCAPPSGSYNLSSASGYTFPETVTYNGKTYTVTTVGVGAFKNARFSSSNTNKVYPMMWLGYNLVEIKSEGFAGCSLNLTGFRSALTTIAPDAFKDNKINWFNISGNSVYTSVNGVIFTQNSTHLTIFGGVHCSATQGGTNFVTSYTIPSGTVAIDDYAMSGNQKITTLNLGSVQSIGKEACARMVALKTLTIPATATTIAPDAFLETSGITTLNVNLTEPVQGVVFDDAVYERLRDKVNFAADANIAAFQADPNWGKFFTKTYPKLYLAGDMTDWANGKLEMNCDNDGNYSITVANVANGAKFKFVNEDASVWYGGETTDANYRVHSGWCTDIALSTSGQDFIIDGTGTLTFNVSADMKLTITGWAAGVYLTGTMTNNWVDREELIVSDGKFTITREMVAGDEFKFVDYANTWYGAVSNGAFVVTDEYLNTELSVTSPGENFKITADNTYVLTFDKANMKFTIEPRPLEAAFQVGKLWYKPVSKTEVEITPDPSGVPYNVKLDNANEITETVTSPNSGMVYTLIGIGENAFKDGAIGTNPSVNGTAHCMEYFFMPATITYISAHAFDNCTSNYPGIRLNNMTTIDDLAFVNNKINWFNTAMSGPVFKINGDNSVAGSATGGELYKEIDGVKTLVCYPGNRHKSAYKTYSYTPYEDNPNYTLTTSADLSFFNVIGPNTFYNNKNITSVTFGASTTAIETDAFKGATAITRITCNATVPPTGAVFEDAVIAACKDKLVIPAGSEAAYRADENWGKFFSTKYAITVTEAENGTVTADKAEAAEGETVTLTVTPAEDYQLATLAVMNGETEVETTTTETGATFVMPAAAVTVTATFTPIPTYDITVAEAENGTVTADKQTAKAGETVTLTVTPAEDYQLATLTVMNGETEVETTTTETGATFVMPAAAVTVTATFTPIPTYDITVAEAENGTVTADKQTAKAGETVTLTVTPAEDYQLATLTVMNGETEVEITTTETGATFVMPAAAVTVTATFTPIPTYDITVAEAENGTVTADKQTAKAGETVTLTVTPAEDYQLATLTVMNGETEVETTTTETGATFVMPAAAVTVTAIFEAIPEPLPGDVFFVDPMYYKVVDENAATCEYAPNPNGPYNVTFASSSALTATVVNPNNGKTYTVIGVGENAFKDGTINSNAATGAISYNHMWWWPNTISYIRAGAFENTSSNFPCIRFNSGFTPGSIDKAAFINNRINQFNPAASGDYYKVTDYNAGNTGDANGRSGLLYCEENGKKTLLVFGGDHHRSSWEKIPDGTQGKANPNYTLTTSVDLSEFNVIGENAFYGNPNIQAITLGTNLEAIETNAFKNVTSITSITCNATVPPTGAVFEDVVYEACKDKLVIPAGSEAAYRADENWGKFFSSLPDSYTITVAEAENGTVIADKVEAEEGETVTVTATPAQGYELTSLTYTAEGAEPQAIENGQFTMPAANVTINATFSLITAELNGVSFANNTYASWYGDQNLAVPENVTAYVVTGIEGDVTIIEEVGYIPAGVGVLLYSTTPADVVNTTAYTGETAEVASMLQGYLEDTAIADGYVLYNDGFVLTLNGTLAAHRCYLPKAQAPAGAPRYLRIIQNDGVVTAIDDVRVTSDGSVKYVNPMGQVSDRPFQGVNIVVDGNKTYKVIKN